MNNPTRYPSRTAWLGGRRGSIGASDVASVLGVASFGGTPWSLHKRLVAEAEGGAVPEVEETEQMAAGRAYEVVNAHRYAAASERAVVELCGDSALWRHPTVEGLHATPDAIQRVGDRIGVLELKHWQWGRHKDGDWSERPPQSIVVQALIQAECVGVDLATAAAVIGGVPIYWHDLEPDRELVALILERIVDFHAMVKARREPDAVPADIPHLRDWYQDVFPGRTVEAVGLSLESLQAALDDAKRANAHVEALKALAMQQAADAEVVTIGGRKIATWKEQARSSYEKTKVGEERMRVWRWSLTAKKTDDGREAEES